MLQFYKIWTTVLVCVACSGCITTLSNDLDEAKSWPPQNAIESEEKPSINVRIVFERITNGLSLSALGGQQINRRAIQGMREVFPKTFRDANLFSRVYNGTQETDLRANVSILDSESSLFLLFSSFSAFVIPGNITQELTMITEFYDADGRAIGAVEKSQKKTTWFHFSLAFVFPFGDYSTDTPNICESLLKATLLEAQQKGYLNTKTL